MAKHEMFDIGSHITKLYIMLNTIIQRETGAVANVVGKNWEEIHEELHSFFVPKILRLGIVT